MSEAGPKAKLSQRKEYYTRRIEDVLSGWGVNKETLASPNKFIDFVDDGEIIDQADELLSRRLSTGYNFATFAQFPINSKDSLFFLCCLRRAHRPSWRIARTNGAEKNS